MIRHQARGVIALVGVALFPLSVLAAGGHQHGVARLDVVIDGATLVVSLESPLDNLLGFEHAPRNEKQRAAVRSMETRLQTADLFKPNAEAGCQLTTVSVEHPYQAGSTKRPVTDLPPSAEAHGDADVSWTYQCARPTALQRIEVSLFARFPGLKSLTVQLAGPRGQTATSLRAGKSVLVW